MAKKKKTVKRDVAQQLYAKMGRITYKLGHAEQAQQQATMMVRQLQKQAADVASQIAEAEEKTGDQDGNKS
jgi:ABC-type uncharacterized transport system substrate-binding protein